jgi:hypothetical protein
MMKEPHQNQMMVVGTSRLLILLLVLGFAAVAEATVPAASTVVAGMVFCDQCKDGAKGLFDYPLYGTVSLGIISSMPHVLAPAHLT